MKIKTNPTKFQVRQALRVLSAGAADRSKADAADAAMGLDRVERARVPVVDRIASSALKSASEAQVLNTVLAYLRRDHRVAWCHRMNTAAFEADGRYIRCGFVGLSDIIGQLRDGRFLAVETKREKGGRVSPEQQAFLDQVIAAGGVAGVARSVEDVAAILGAV